MAPKRLAACLFLVAALTGCDQVKGVLGKLGLGGSKEAPAPDLAVLKAKRDSVARARAVTDSVARVRWTGCSDSVAAVMKKTAKGRKALAAKLPEGMIRPEFLAACGGMPASLASRPARAPATKPDTGKAKPAPAMAQKADSGKVKLTPKQLQVARADSIRKAREQVRADSLARLAMAARADSIRKFKNDSTAADSVRIARETEIMRETFAYSGGTRDPFASLVKSASVGPELADLNLVAIYQDMRYANNSVAILRDKKSGRRFRLKVGDELGRMKVAQIRQKDVVFTIEDFGFERQETLSLRRPEEQTP